MPRQEVAALQRLLHILGPRLRPVAGTRRSSQASLRFVAGEGRGEPIGYYVCIRDPAPLHSRGLLALVAVCSRVTQRELL